MPYMSNGKRDYKKEKAQYEDKHPKRKTDRAARNRARYKLEKAGKVKKGDGKDVDHKKPLSKGGTNSTKNLRVRSASANRSFKRTSKGKMK